MGMNKKTVGVVGLVMVLGTGAVVMAYQVSRGPVKVTPSPQPSPRVIVSNPGLPSNEVTDWVAGWPELTSPIDDNPKTKAMLKALDEPIPMHFPNDTPLADVLSSIRKATERPELPKGLIIYVDPIGLQDADKTLADTVTMELEDVPLKTTLRLLLRQLSLAFDVREGLMTITSTQSDDEVTPFLIMQGKAIRGELSREQYKQLIEALRLKNEILKLGGAD
jgi:hypothetical protein